MGITPFQGLTMGGDDEQGATPLADVFRPFRAKDRNKAIYKMKSVEHTNDLKDINDFNDIKDKHYCRSLVFLNVVVVFFLHLLVLF